MCVETNQKVKAESNMNFQKVIHMVNHHKS